MRVDSTDGVSLAVHDLGGDGPPLLICHATGFCGMAYAPFAEGLRDLRHVWAVDFRGHGDSTSPEHGDFDWGGAGEDLLAVVDALGAAPIDVVGHSMGGAAAVLAEHERPDTLRSAYLFEPIIPPSEFGEAVATENNPMADAARRRRAVFGSKAEALYRYATKTPLARLSAGALGAYVEHGFEDLPDGTAQLKLAPEEEADVFSATGKPTTDTAKDVETPVTIAIGMVEEGFSPALFGEALVEALPNGHLVRFDDLGHFGPLEAPTIIAADVRGWLRARS